MALRVDTTDRRHEMVSNIEIRIGDEWVKHNFGRRVSMAHARELAQHYLDVFTGAQPSAPSQEQSK